MKYILIPTIILLFFQIATARSSLTDLKTKVSGYFPLLRDSVYRVDYSYLDEDGSIINNEAELINGYFSISLIINTPRWLTISVNNKILLLPSSFMIVLPGDDIGMHINDYGIQNIVAKGKGSAKIEYEKERFELIKKYQQETVPLIKMNLEERINYADNTCDISEKLLRSYRKKMSNDEIQIIQSNLYIESYNLIFYNIQKNRPKMDEYTPLYKRLIDNTRLRSLFRLSQTYFNAINPLLRHLLFDYVYLLKSIKDERYYDSKASMLTNYNLVDEFYKDYQIREFLLFRYLRSNLSRGMTPELHLCIDRFLDTFPPESIYYANIYEVYENVLTNVVDGASSYDFSLLDTLGNQVSIQKYKGKVVVIDFWFTGCVGCASITPQMNEIEGIFHENMNVVFLSISVDKYKDRWLSGIGTFAANNSVHLNVGNDGKDHPVIKHYNIFSYPTLMILDREGKIFKARATKPYTRSLDKKLILIREIQEALN